MVVGKNENAVLTLFILVVISKLTPIIGETRSNCSEGDIWPSDDNCYVYECGNNSQPIKYSKVCPPVPTCLAFGLYYENCCQYCNERALQNINGDITWNDFETHPCKRDCVSGNTMTCIYSFDISAFLAFNAACNDCPVAKSDCDITNCVPTDGITKLILVANRTIPGPSIEVCAGDTVAVEARNGLISQAIVLHWHGIPQLGTPYADGVPYITQCPTIEEDSYLYIFHAINPGSYFWNSDEGLEKVDGLLGSLIIRQPMDKDPHAALYDTDDNVIFIQNWYHTFSESKLYGWAMSSLSSLSDNFLINGRGRILKRLNSTYEETSTDSAVTEAMPFAEFRVATGSRNRFRIINAGSAICPVAVSVDNHTLTVISADGFDIAPIEVQRIVMNNGERFDVIIQANQPVGNYWIRVKGVQACTSIERQQLAILRYGGSSADDPTQPTDYYFPSDDEVTLDSTYNDDSSSLELHLTDLQSVRALEPELSSDQVNNKFYIRLGYSSLSNPAFMASPNSLPKPRQQFNNITFEFPPTCLLTQPDEDHYFYCNEDSLRDQGKNCVQELCTCIHILRVALNSTVEVILFNGDAIPADNDKTKSAQSAVHLHGYNFRVLGMEKVPGINEEKIRQMDKNGEIKRNFINPIIKDTVNIVQPGYTVIRFNATNAGAWALHSTVQFKYMTGTALLFMVGERSDLPPIPTGLPMCRNFIA